MVRLRELLFGRTRPDVVEEIRARLERFRDLVEHNNRALELMADAEEMLTGDYLFDRQYLRWLDGELAAAVEAVVQDLTELAPGRHRGLEQAFERIHGQVSALVEMPLAARTGPLCVELGQGGSEQACLLGEKMARLAELRTRVGAPVPPGFVVTAPAFGQLARGPQLEALLAAADAQDVEPASAAAALQTHLAGVPLPKAVVRAIQSSLKPFGRGDRFAVRSSAVAEDGGLSFAGIHQSVMNVPRRSVVAAYQQVVASLFSAQALRYRRSHGLSIAGAAMAVGCMRMVPAVTSGVLYTVDPSDPAGDAMVISATWGHGATVVEGAGPVDRFRVARQPPHHILDAIIADKTHQLIAASDPVLHRVAVAPERRRQPSLDAPAVAQLAALALAVERHMRCPQDIEWALDEHGAPWILQARPLTLGPPPRRSNAPAAVQPNHPVLFRGRGEVACRGVGAGCVVVVTPTTRPQDTPAGSVLVTRYPVPALSALLPSAAALVADSGSPTSHLAALAREHRVPSIVATEVASRVLEPGMDVTVDAEDNVIYAGRVEVLIRDALWRGDPYGDRREFRTLRSMLRFVTPLQLSDPSARRFTPARCASYHDIIRFAHEKAVLALSDRNALDLRAARRHLRRVVLDIPLGLSLVDLGGGVAPAAPAGDVQLSHLTCAPLAALLEELVAPGVWSTRPAGMDMRTLLSSATRSDVVSPWGATDVRQNLAIVSARYVNLSLYLGFHYNVIDCYLGDGPEDSYMLFRFVGGASDLARRTRRVDLLTEILGRHDFAVERAGDLLLARLHGVPASTMVRRLRMTGRLIGFTRQLDVLLRDDDVTQKLIGEFLAHHLPAAVRGEAPVVASQVPAPEHDSTGGSDAGECVARRAGTRRPGGSCM